MDFDETPGGITDTNKGPWASGSSPFDGGAQNAVPVMQLILLTILIVLTYVCNC